MIARIRKALEEKDRGFTLIELLVVIIIIGILAAIAIPIFLNQRKKAYNSAVQNDLHSAALAEESYMTDNGSYYAGTSGALTTTDTTLVADGLKFSPSSDYAATPGQELQVWTYNSAGTAVTDNTTATGGFCLEGTSSSGNVYVYDSANGGLQPASSTYRCSSTDTYVNAAA